MTDEMSASDERRNFIFVATGAVAFGGAAMAAWPLVDQMNPAADTLALANIEVDVSKIVEGQSITVKWRGKPVFIRHRTSDEIARANATNVADLRDPQVDEARAERPEYLVLVGVCRARANLHKHKQSNHPDQQQHPYHYFTVINIKKCSGSFHRAVMFH